MTEQEHEEITQVESPLGRVLQAARDCNAVAAEGKALNLESKTLNMELRSALDAVLGLVGKLDGLADNLADLRAHCPACRASLRP